MEYFVLIPILLFVAAGAVGFVYTRLNTKTETLPEREYALSHIRLEKERSRVKLTVIEKTGLKKVTYRRGERMSERHFSRERKLFFCVDASPAAVEELSLCEDSVLRRFIFEIAEAAGQKPSWYRRAAVKRAWDEKLKKISAKEAEIESVYMPIYKGLRENVQSLLLELDEARAELESLQLQYDKIKSKTAFADGNMLCRGMYRIFNSKAKREALLQERRRAAMKVHSAYKMEAVLEREYQKSARQMLAVAHKRSQRLKETDRERAECERMLEREMSEIKPIS